MRSVFAARECPSRHSRDPINGVWSRRFARTETRYLTPTIPTHMLPEEGRDAHARYACRVQARRVEHGVQSDHMERLVGGAPPKWALESSRLLVRGPSKRAIVKLPTTVQYNCSVHMHRVLLRRDRVGGGERPALVARQSKTKCRCLYTVEISYLSATRAI